MRKRFVFLAAIALTAVLPLAASQLVVDWNLALQSDISGTPGQTVGWGYQITNPNADVWVAVESIGFPQFNVGSPTQLINMSADNAPVLAPGQTVTQYFDWILGYGLLGLTIDPYAPGYALDAGLFTLTFDLYDADPMDPLANANLLGTFDSSQPFSVSVTPVPEPATWDLMLGAMLTIAGLSRRLRARRAG